MKTRNYPKRGFALVLLLCVTAYGASNAVGLASATNNSSAHALPLTSAKHMFADLAWAPGETDAEVAHLWGTAEGPSGMLIRARAGYSTGPVVRTSDYRAFVISGSVATGIPGGEEPEAMGAGTFWVQPGGAAHVTSCPSDCVFYVEPEGPWDRLPATTIGDSPGGLEARRIAAGDLPWFEVPNTGGTVKLAHVWGNPEDTTPSGFFLFLKAGFPGNPHMHTHSYDGVVLQGRHRHWERGETNIAASTAGSHLWQAGGAPHDDSCEEGKDCIAYFRFHGMFDIHPAEAQ